VDKSALAGKYVELPIEKIKPISPVISTKTLDK